MKIDVLDKGFVKLVDKMGDDYSILRAARVSTGSEIIKGDTKDRGLIRYLYKMEHMTPFEMVTFTFHLKLPLFVNQQLLRHRSFSFNQESARYKEFEWNCHYPTEFRIQDTKNKQGSLGEIENHEHLTKDLYYTYNQAEDFYKGAITEGVAREQARVVMPMGQYTEIFFTTDLRNLLHFIDLRMDAHAQEEIRMYAEAILAILEAQEDLKWTIEIFKEMFALKQAIKRNLVDLKTTADFEAFTDYIMLYSK